MSRYTRPLAANPKRARALIPAEGDPGTAEEIEEATDIVQESNGNIPSVRRTVVIGLN
jgi:hypothetical protein